MKKKDLQAISATLRPGGWDSDAGSRGIRLTEIKQMQTRAHVWRATVSHSLSNYLIRPLAQERCCFQ